ncbi:DUF7017 domain-containing protein [Succinatimonas hippei]|uniref:DUF7017 domain-containing protein n=1 Tax=Succinatimonas hippei TaxID=626938 RepID=UPI0023F6FDA8|nr:hypothetical protein [Succinatimonas hippei]
MTEVYEICSKITYLRKQNNISEARKIGHDALIKYPNDKNIKNACFWVCYTEIKNTIKNFEERTKSQKNVEFNGKEISDINNAIYCIEWFNLPNDNINKYRILLLLIIKYIKHFPQIFVILTKNFDSLFIEKDFIPFKAENNKESPSLAYKFAKVLSDIWIKNIYELPKKIHYQTIITIMNNIIAKCKDKSDSKIWLYLNLTKLYLLLENYKEAQNLAKIVLDNQRQNGWAWGCYADTLNDDFNSKKIFYCKGISCCQDENFSTRMMLNLAYTLVEQQNFSYATMCIKKLSEIYKKNNWNLKPKLKNLLKKTWYNPNIDITPLKKFIQSHSDQAENLLYANKKTIYGIVERTHKSGKGFNVYIDENTSIKVNKHLLKNTANLPQVGEGIILTITEKNDPLYANTCVFKENEKIKIQQGILKVKTNANFGFVNDIYIPNYLINQNYINKNVIVLAIRKINPKRNNLSWTCIKINLS